MNLVSIYFAGSSITRKNNIMLNINLKYLNLKIEFDVFFLT